jgi:hypothetical protein
LILRKELELNFKEKETCTMPQTKMVQPGIGRYQGKAFKKSKRED